MVYIPQPELDEQLVWLFWCNLPTIFDKAESKAVLQRMHQVLLNLMWPVAGRGLRGTTETLNDSLINPRHRYKS